MEVDKRTNLAHARNCFVSLCQRVGCPLRDGAAAAIDMIKVDDQCNKIRPRPCLDAWVCLDPSNFQKFYKILHHVESLNACMEH
jgi:hypothetical protein